MRGGQKSGASRLKASACQCFNLRTADLNGKHSEKSAGRKCPPSLGMAGGNMGGRDQLETLKWMGGTHTGKKPQRGIRRQEQTTEFPLTVSDTDRSAHHERNLRTVSFLQRVDRCRSFRRNLENLCLSHQNIIQYATRLGLHSPSASSRGAATFCSVESVWPV